MVPIARTTRPREPERRGNRQQDLFSTGEPARGLQRFQKRDQRLALLRGERFEPVPRPGSLPSMQLDRLLERPGASIVEEMSGEAQAHKGLRSELGWPREAEANVRQIRAHVVDEKIGVREESFSIEGPHGTLPRTKCREMARGASDAIE